MRAKKNTVGIESVKGMLRLRLPRSPFNGQQKYLSLGLPDTAKNREIAQNKATQIEYDIALEKVDLTLNQYRSGYHHETTPLLIDLWEAYTEFKAKELSVTTINKDFKKARNHILSLPTQKISQAKSIKKWLLNNLTIDAAKRCLVQINACCEWALDQEMIKNNPFKEIKITARTGKKKAINPFTKSEKDLIIHAFENSEAHGHFADFVKFLFLTGCRPSEAIALTWDDISPNLECVTFSHAFVEKHDKDTKTHKVRKFPINNQLRELLNGLSKKSPQLFLSKEGCMIDGHNFSEREWKPLLKTLPIKYRIPYNCRHTFISHCLDSGIPVTTIAEWVGNSSKTIWEKYAGLVTKFDVPEM
jgi:integrase